jgi:Uma2 family endonuclease
MATPAEQLRMALSEFLEWDDGTDTRYELIDGRVVAMAPASGVHAVVVSNLTVAIGNKLSAPCYVGNEAGIRLPDRDDAFYHADLAVSCTPLQIGVREVPEPRLIVEVLSPSTTAHDRGRKGEDYRRIPSVQEILFVSSEDRRVELWRREGRRWVIEDFIGDAAVRLETVNAENSLAAIYANVAFEEAAGETG